MPNNIAVSEEANAILCKYPLIKIRTDMSFNEYLNYVNDWKLFDYVWSYNYTVRALRTNESYYQFIRYSDLVSYRKGQFNHVNAYPDAPADAFNNIP
jgi:hypothetical protein